MFSLNFHVARTQYVPHVRTFFCVFILFDTTESRYFVVSNKIKRCIPFKRGFFNRFIIDCMNNAFYCLSVQKYINVISLPRTIFLMSHHMFYNVPSLYSN